MSSDDPPDAADASAAPSAGDDPFRLRRFVAAQAPVIAQALAELGRGRKESHWMWFVFPQLQGLGRSATAQHYGLVSEEEAAAYARHPVLGQRLLACTRLVLAVEGRSALQIFGTPDDLKLRSSMTLFERAAPQRAEFGALLDQLFEGRRDEATRALLAAAATRAAASAPAEAPPGNS